MGRPKTIDHDKVKRAILEFLCPEKTAGMFLGFPTIRVHEYIVKFWKVRCSQKVVFNNLKALEEKGLVISKKSRLGHYYWKGVPHTFFREDSAEYLVDLKRKTLKRKQRRIYDDDLVRSKTTKDMIKEIKTRKNELRRLGYDVDETPFLFYEDPFPQFEASWIKDCSPDTILNGLEDAYRRITPPNKKKRRLLKELEYIRREKKEKKGLPLEENEKCYRHWGKALPQMTMVFCKLLKELEEEQA